MYCKFCGKEIDGDSLYCKHCGSNIATDKLHNKALSGLFTRFSGLTKARQVAIMTYFLWFWIVFIICVAINGSTRHFNWSQFIIGIIVFELILPALFLFIWYATRNKWFKFKNRNINDTSSSNINTTDAAGEIVILKTSPLMKFITEHGKMQLLRTYDKKTSTYIVSYIFTNSNGNRTKVDPSEEVQSLTAEELVRQKIHYISMSIAMVNSY